MASKQEKPPIPEPFVIEPNALYSLAWLEERLAGIVELPTFLERLKLRNERRFRDALWGREILEALERTEPYTASQHQTSVVDMTRPKRSSPTRSDRIRRLGAKDLEKST